MQKETDDVFTKSELRLWSAILRLSHSSGELWASSKTLSQQTGLSVRTIQEKLRNFCWCGLLVPIPQAEREHPGAAKHYRVQAEQFERIKRDWQAWLRLETPADL